MRILAGVVVAVFVLAPLATLATRRRRSGRGDGGGRPLPVVLAEGLIVLAAFVGVVLVVVALLD